MVHTSHLDIVKVCCFRLSNYTSKRARALQWNIRLIVELYIIVGCTLF